MSFITSIWITEFLCWPKTVYKVSDFLSAALIFCWFSKAFYTVWIFVTNPALSFTIHTFSFRIESSAFEIWINFLFRTKLKEFVIPYRHVDQKLSGDKDFTASLSLSFLPKSSTVYIALFLWPESFSVGIKTNAFIGTLSYTNVGP